MTARKQRIPMEEGEQLLDTVQAATFLNMSPSWVQRQAQLGLLPAIRIGRSLRFDPEVLRAFVKGQIPGTEQLVQVTGPKVE